MRNLCILFAGGKDSVYALHWAVMKGFEIACLLTLKPAIGDTRTSRGSGVELTALQARAMGLPILYVECGRRGEGEYEDLLRGLETALSRYGAEGVVASACLPDYQRMKISMACEELGLSMHAPLRKGSHEDYMRELVDSGFEFVLTSIDCYGIPPRFLGRIIKGEELEELILLSKKYDFNPAFGEGEAETLVLDAPLFKKSLAIRGDVIKVGEYSWKLAIREAWLVRKGKQCCILSRKTFWTSF